MSIAWETEYIVNSTYDYVWEYEYEITGSLIDGVDSLHRICL